MAASVVQSNSANTTTTPATVVLGAAPTTGNTLMAIMASDTTATAVPTAGAGNTYTQRVSAVANQGWYVWTRLVAGGESATTSFSPSGANPAALMVIEIQGTYDKAGTNVHVVGSAASSLAVTGVSPATTDGIVIAVVGYHSTSSPAGSGGAATGFTLIRSQHATTFGSTVGGIVAAYLVTSTTSATASTTMSWTGASASDRDGVQVAFTGIGGGAPPYNFARMMPPRTGY